MAVWYGTSSVLIVAILGMTPETEIETWAQQEAAVRLGVPREELEFGTHYLQVRKQQVANKWDKFSTKSTRWDEDDDDDEEEDDEE